jgi:hypothetical protein
MTRWLRRSLRAWAILSLAACSALRTERRTAVEINAFERPSMPEEIVAFLTDLDREHEEAELRTIGQSAGGRPLVALLLGIRPGARQPHDAGKRQLRALIIGSQHGTEPSGGEAIQILARQILSGERRDLSEDFELILVPDANPDGRAARRRVNANGVNLSTNYNVASEPETEAILDVLERWRPDVVLDVHESAILKKKTLGAQGYMTDFQAQVEIGTNPNIDPDLRLLSASLLDQTIARINAAGVGAQHYIGEITDVAQPITHGGLSVKNLRNLAAMRGAVSFLIENRLDPPGRVFLTPRNLRGRIEKQLASIDAFLAVCRARRDEIGATVERVRQRSRAPDPRKVLLVARWAANPAEPEITVPLRRIDDGTLEQRVFARHDVIEGLQPLALPRAYAVTAHQEALRRVLDRHHVAYAILSSPVSVDATVARVGARVPVPGRHGWGYADYELVERRETVTFPAGTLWIDLDQPLRRLIPLLLEPRSNSGIFQDPQYAKLIEVGEDFFIASIGKIPT